MDELLKLGKDAGIKRLSEHEQNGTLVEYISKIAPEYVDKGTVLKFTLLRDLGWM